MEKCVLGSDYSSTTVYLGVTCDKKVMNCGSVAIPKVEDSDRTTFKILQNVIYELYSQYETEELVFIESPWVNGNHFPMSGLMLARTASWIETAVLELGLTSQFVHPGTWRKEVFGNGRPQNAKDVAVDFVKEKFNYDVPVFGKTGRGKVPDHNFADAICISHYGWLKENLVKARMGR